MRLSAFAAVAVLFAFGHAGAQPRDPPTYWRSGSGPSAACFELAEGRVRVRASNFVRVADYSLVGETLTLEKLREEDWTAWHPDLYGPRKAREERQRLADRRERADDEIWLLLRGLPRVEKHTASELVLRARDGRRARFTATRVCDLPER